MRHYLLRRKYWSTLMIIFIKKILLYPKYDYSWWRIKLRLIKENKLM